MSYSLVNAAAGFNSPQHTGDQAGDTKLWHDEPFDRGDLADIHSQDAGPVGQGRDEIQRVIPPESTGLRRPERRNQRRIEAVTIERQIDRTAAGLRDIGNSSRRFPFIWTGRIEQLPGEES